MNSTEIKQDEKSFEKNNNSSNESVNNSFKKNLVIISPIKEKNFQNDKENEKEEENENNEENGLKDKKIHIIRNVSYIDKYDRLDNNSYTTSKSDSNSGGSCSIY